MRSGRPLKGWSIISCIFLNVASRFAKDEEYKDDEEEDDEGYIYKLNSDFLHFNPSLMNVDEDKRRTELAQRQFSSGAEVGSFALPC